MSLGRLSSESTEMLDLVTTKAAEVGQSINVPTAKFYTHDRMIQLQCNGEPLEAVQFTNIGRLDGNITSEVSPKQQVASRYS